MNYSRSWYILSFILMSALIISCNKHKRPDFSKPPKYATAQAFKSEGILWFLSASKGDTLSCIFVEIADDEGKREKGLMYRTRLDPDQGMLFVFETMQIQSFWMHNTPISLDMVFVDDTYKIVHIAENTIPYSVRSVSSQKPARYVVETNAGYCSKNSIKTGDIIGYKRISNNRND